VAGQGGRPICAEAPSGGKSKAPGPLGRARGAGHGGSSPASLAWAGMGQRGSRKPRSSAVLAVSWAPEQPPSEKVQFFLHCVPSFFSICLSYKFAHI
jgi:hypothetical protein